MSAVLSIEEVHAVLEQAIIGARLATPEQAGEFARLLTTGVQAGVNELVGAKEVRTGAVEVAEAAVGEGLMSMVEALSIRNRVAEAIAHDPVTGNWSATAAERLLLLGYIDVARVRDVPDGDPEDDGLVSRPVSGAVVQQVLGAVSERTGMIPTITAADLAG